MQERKYLNRSVTQRQSTHHTPALAAVALVPRAAAQEAGGGGRTHLAPVVCDVTVAAWSRAGGIMCAADGLHREVKGNAHVPHCRHAQIVH